MSDAFGPLGSYATDKHPSYKKALKNFKKNAVIKMFFKKSSNKNKDELVKEDSHLVYSKDFLDYFKHLRKRYTSLNEIRNRIKSFIKNWKDFDVNEGRITIQNYYKSLIRISSPAREEALKTEMELVLEVFPLGIKETQNAINQIKAKSSKLPNKQLKINEALQAVKFRYTNSKHDPVPEVKVLDTEYLGRPEQKTYGKRKDVLAWNLNYFSNKKEAALAIDEIDSFARLLAADKKEKYNRVKTFFPEQAQYLRRYIKEKCKGVKIKHEGLWKQTDWEEIKKLDDQSF